LTHYTCLDFPDHYTDKTCPVDNERVVSLSSGAASGSRTQMSSFQDTMKTAAVATAWVRERSVDSSHPISLWKEEGRSASYRYVVALMKAVMTPNVSVACHLPQDAGGVRETAQLWKAPISG